MNKQRTNKYRQRSTNRGLINPLRNRSAIGVVGTAVLLILLAAVSIALAQSSQVNLIGGEVAEVLCEGRGFQIERISRTHLNLTCRAPDQTESPSPTTQPPAVPTESLPPATTELPTPLPTEPPAPTEPPSLTPTAVADACHITTGWLPLNDLGAGAYHGFQGGLYPGGSNVPPVVYQDAALVAANAINTAEPYAMLAVGMSNTMREFEAFKALADADPAKNPNLFLVNGAQTGQDSADIVDPNADYWDRIDRKLAQLRLGPEHVRVVWLKQVDAEPEGIFPDDALQLESELHAIVDILNQRFPNLGLIYTSSRIYAGYATNNLHPEPYAYQSGFAVKWLVEDHVNAPAPDEPVVLWGPYLWADGLNPRSDGLAWECADYRNDMTHPSEQGEQKVANLLLAFFKTDATATWFSGSNTTP